MTLNELSLNEICYIKELNSEGEVRRRMLDMGLIPGTKLESVFKAPFGEPTAYLVRGTLIALRDSDAEKIVIRHENMKGITENE
ncbi:MAG: ferrous iron transport protein A [Ruminococcaceae bacterium]|nr:ferrous iron transport protein A [Oscillospiraceae bacterium]